MHVGERVVILVRNSAFKLSPSLLFNLLLPFDVAVKLRDEIINMTIQVSIFMDAFSMVSARNVLSVVFVSDLTHLA